MTQPATIVHVGLKSRVYRVAEAYANVVNAMRELGRVLFEEASYTFAQAAAADADYVSRAELTHEEANINAQLLDRRCKLNLRKL